MVSINRYAVEWCPFCEDEVVIHANSATKCPECGATLFPCSACDIDRASCNNMCPYGTEEGLKNVLEISREDIKKYLKK